MVIIALIVWSAMTMVTGLAWSLAALIAIRFLFGIAEGRTICRVKAYFRKLRKKGEVAGNVGLDFVKLRGSCNCPLIIVLIIANSSWRQGLHWLGAQWNCHYPGLLPFGTAHSRVSAKKSRRVRKLNGGILTGRCGHS